MNIPPPDAVAHEDGRLVHDLAVINTKITRYVLNYLDADARRAAPLSVTEELALADELLALAQRVQVRANRRAGALDDGATQPRALEPGRQPDMDNGP